MERHIIRDRIATLHLIRPDSTSTFTIDPAGYRVRIGGARGGGRTRTPLRELDFESSASANSATRAITRAPKVLNRECESKHYCPSVAPAN